MKDKNLYFEHVYAFISLFELQASCFQIYPHEEDSPSFVAGVHQVPDVIKSRHSQFGQILHVWAKYGMLPDTQCPLRLWVQQITDPLTVDLHVGHLEMEETAFSKQCSLNDSV